MAAKVYAGNFNTATALQFTYDVEKVDLMSDGAITVVIGAQTFTIPANVAYTLDIGVRKNTVLATITPASGKIVSWVAYR